MEISSPTTSQDSDLQEFEQVIKDLPKVVETKLQLARIFNSIHHKLNQGHYYQDILDSIFDSLDALIPFDRIGIALLECEGENEGCKIRLHWVKSKLPITSLKKDYVAEMKNSRLQQIINTEIPRIINDLEEYLKAHPESKSTKLALLDGIKSSLTCPLIMDGSPLGLIFFSSGEKCTYESAHGAIFNEISQGLSLVIQQGLLKESISKIRSKEKVFRDTIHDLNNPLNIIQITLEMLEKKKWFQDLGSESQNVFKTLKRNCESMINLTKDLGRMNVIQSSESTLNIESIPMDEFLMGIMNDSKLIARHKNIQITFKKAENVPACASFDVYKLKEALGNLVSNAVKYSERDSKVSILVKVVDHRLYFSVIDHGQGIPQDEICKLFKDFGKTSVRPTAGEQSSGLGLSNVKRLVEAHKGEVSMESQVGVGSTFSFWIPLEA